MSNSTASVWQNMIQVNLKIETLYFPDYFRICLNISESWSQVKHWNNSENT